MYAHHQHRLRMTAAHRLYLQQEKALLLAASPPAMELLLSRLKHLSLSCRLMVVLLLEQQQ